MENIWRKVQTWVLGGLFLIVIFEVVLMAPKAVNEPSPKSQAVVQDVEVQQSMSGVHVMETKSETREWELWADKALGFRVTGDMKLDTVKAIFFTADGATFTVTGQTGAVEAQTKNMKIEGNVITKSSNGYIFQTNSVVYDSQKKVLLSDSPVLVHGPREASGDFVQITGLGMKATLEQGKMSILNEVKANKSLPQTGKMTIQSSSAEFSSRAKEMRFDGNVVLDFSGVRVKGPSARFMYDSKQDLLRGIELEGGVQLSDWNKWATADRVNINLQDNKYVFNGRPRVVQDEDELMGDEIIFLNGGKKVKVKNARIKVGKESLRKVN